MKKIQFASIWWQQFILQPEQFMKLYRWLFLENEAQRQNKTRKENHGLCLPLVAAADTAASAVYDGFFPLRLGGGGGEIYIYHGLCLSLVAKAHTAANAVYDGFSIIHSQEGEEGEGVEITVCAFIWWQKLILQPKPKFNKSEVMVTGQNRTRRTPA